MDQVRSFFWNAWYGTLSPSQKEEAIQQEAADLVKASGGTLHPAVARQIATNDVNSVLLANNADPSQASISNWALWGTLKDSLRSVPSWVWLVLVVVGGFFVVDKATAIAARVSGGAK
jgi:hypothetical protein